MSSSTLRDERRTLQKTVADSNNDLAEAATPITSNRHGFEILSTIELPAGADSLSAPVRTASLSPMQHVEILSPSTVQLPRFSSQEIEPILAPRQMLLPMNESNGQQLSSRGTISYQTSNGFFPYVPALPLARSGDADYLATFVLCVSTLTPPLLEYIVFRITYFLQNMPINSGLNFPRLSEVTRKHIPQTRQRPPQDGDGRVRGIVNFGQTCFLNSVMQSLASLEPFVAYLEYVVEKEKKDTLQSYFSEPTTGDDLPDSRVSEGVLSLLLAVNGVVHTESIDPREILVSVGQQHSQFKSKSGGSSRHHIGNEQQDAEEFLQALVGMIVGDAKLDGESSVVPSAFAGFCNSDCEQDDILTVLSRERSPHIVRSDADSYIPSLLVGGKRDGVDKQPPSQVAAKDSRPITSAKERIQSVSPVNNFQGQREEKKQEDFEMCVPEVRSEGSDVHARSLTPGKTTSTPLICDLDSRERRELSTAMHIMMTTISSITPSPFCGWLGSTLQCRICKHIRPIQNAAFFDIPVVPTTVLASSGRRSYAGTPQKPESAPSPPCRLEECLERFTNVERVQDVECRCCTLRNLIEKLEEDVDFLRGAVEALHAKSKRNEHNKEDEQGFYLRDELERTERRLNDARQINPDDDARVDAFLLSDPSDSLEGISESQETKMERVDALKCLLLTRLPSILCIHVQRRYYDPHYNRLSKTAQHVIFPEVLDAGPYCAYGGRVSPTFQWAGTSPRQKFTSNTNSTPSPIHYRLMSAIEHQGGAFSGHYVCYRRSQMTGRWLFISDDSIKEVDWQKVCQCQAYMLFYEAM
jgi:ubiquitin C-terminal hydrolase